MTEPICNCKAEHWQPHATNCPMADILQAATMRDDAKEAPYKAPSAREMTWEDPTRAILQAATRDPADDQSFVGKWRTTIKAMPDTYEQAANPTGTTMTIDIINSAADATMSRDEREAFDKFSDDTKQRFLNQIVKRAAARDALSADAVAFGPFEVTWIGAGVWAGIVDELPGELAGKKVYLMVAPKGDGNDCT